MRHVLVFSLLALASCSSSPTPAQRTAGWYKFRDVTRAECVVGTNDPAMPVAIREWCQKVTAP